MMKNAFYLGLALFAAGVAGWRESRVALGATFGVGAIPVRKEPLKSALTFRAGWPIGTRTRLKARSCGTTFSNLVLQLFTSSESSKEIPW